jgi:CBS domain-containing protein
MTGVIFVVTNVLSTVGWAAAVAAVSAGWLAWLWFGLALRRRLRETPRSSGFDNSPRLRPGREERTAQPPGVTTRREFAEKARSGRRDRVRRFAMRPGTVLLQEEHAHLLAHIEASRRGRRGGRMSNMKSTVRDVMTSTVVTVTHAAPFKEIVEKLAKYGISALPVIGPGGGVVGVISEADLMLKEERTPEMTRSLFEGRRRRRERTKMWGKVAGELMTSPAVTIGPEASVAEAARLMHEKHVKRLPVVDGNGALVGIVSRRDVLRIFLRPDEEIRDEIVHRVIRGILWLGPRAVHVHVRRGVITLEGEVKRKSMIPLITELVEGVEGVVAVAVRLGFRFDDTNVRAEGMDPWGMLAHGLRYP